MSAAATLKPSDPPLRNVLVVDDEEFIRDLTIVMLETLFEGLDIVSVENGAEGVAAFLSRREESPPEFDLVLMDIEMPVLCGDLAVRQIRALQMQHGWPHTCIIARTANTSAADLERYEQCGMDGCLPKAGNVAKQVCSALQQRRQHPGKFVSLDVG